MKISPDDLAAIYGQVAHEQLQRAWLAEECRRSLHKFIKTFWHVVVGDRGHGLHVAFGEDGGTASILLWNQLRHVVCANAENAADLAAMMLLTFDDLGSLNDGRKPHIRQSPAHRAMLAVM